MGKKLLLIGGTYFVGRVFSIMMSRAGHSLTFLNRGKYSMKPLGTVKEIVCDRRDADKLKKISSGENSDTVYDAVIDFCAYEPGDIALLYENLSFKWKQYIYFSTADVYARTMVSKTEEAPLKTKKPEDEVELYAYKKMCLEEELKKQSEKRGNSYTILRPAFIYGPYNYAPRESWFIRQIIQEGTAYRPVDADGAFQMVYVKDVANAVSLCMDSSEAQNTVYNLSAPEIMTYDRYLGLLRTVSDRAFQTMDIRVEEALEQRIPLPFPLWKEESELFDGSKIVRELGLEYSRPEEAMRLTFDAFKGVYDRG
ncbi:MAG: NAD-dependent epimerase/dehydratase family protein [Eubacterium sp.]|nr:NAD-dependent epimerase/dehydratase family protein [Eubacterium sp.]